jgi:hypothetical protein
MLKHVTANVILGLFIVLSLCSAGWSAVAQKHLLSIRRLYVSARIP